jgi:hypothetical protein
MRKLLVLITIFLSSSLLAAQAYSATSEPVSETTAMLLLGSGLIGLAGYGRKKFFKK